MREYEFDYDSIERETSLNIANFGLMEAVVLEIHLWSLEAAKLKRKVFVSPLIYCKGYSSSTRSNSEHIRTPNKSATNIQNPNRCSLLVTIFPRFRWDLRILSSAVHFSPWAMLFVFQVCKEPLKSCKVETTKSLFNHWSLVRMIPPSVHHTLSVHIWNPNESPQTLQIRNRWRALCYDIPVLSIVFGDSQLSNSTFALRIAF